MSSRKSKATKLIDRFMLASKFMAMKDHMLDEEEIDDADEEYFMARSALQYHIETLQKKVRALQSQLIKVKEEK